MDLKSKKRIIKECKMEIIFNEIYTFMTRNKYNIIQLEDPVKIVGKKKMEIGILDNILNTLKEAELHIGLWDYNQGIEIVFNYSKNVADDVNSIENLLLHKYITSPCKKENKSSTKTKTKSNKEISELKETLNNIYQQIKQDFLEEKKCPSCQKKIKENWISCPYCSYLLKSNLDQIMFNNSNKRLDEDYINDKISREDYLKKKERIKIKG